MAHFRDHTKEAFSENTPKTKSYQEVLSYINGLARNGRTKRQNNYNAMEMVNALTALLNHLSGNAVEGTYADFELLKQRSQLVAGQNYIFEYTCNHIIPSTLGTTNTEAKDSLTKAPTAELILVTAATNNSFIRTAFSLDFPGHILYYNFDGTTMGNHTPLSGIHTGYVYRRHDVVSNIDMFCDWKWVVQRSFEADMTSVGGELTSPVLGSASVSVGQDINATGDQKWMTFAALDTVNQFEDSNIFGDGVLATRNIFIGNDYLANSEIPNIVFKCINGSLGRINNVTISSITGPNRMLDSGGEGFEHINLTFLSNSIFMGKGFHFAGYGGWISGCLFAQGFQYFATAGDLIGLAVYNIGGASTYDAKAIDGTLIRVEYSEIRISGTANEVQLDIMDMEGASINIVNTVAKPDAGGGNLQHLVIKIHGLKPVVKDWNGVDAWRGMKIPTSNPQFVRGVFSNIEFSQAGAANVNVARFIDNNVTYETENAGVIFVPDGTPAVQIDTIEVNENGPDHEIMIVPDAAVTITIPHNNIKDGFVVKGGANLVVAGANGEVARIKRFRDRWYVA